MMETNKSTSCLCEATENIVLACSGASDLGQVSDLVARKLTNNNIRKMNCLAVVGADIKKSIENFKKKDVLVIDGCPVDCGKQILDKAGFSTFKHLRVTELGYKKGQTPVTEKVVNNVYENIKTIQ